MIQNWHCDFSDPRDALGITPLTAVAFQYRQQDCYVTASSSQPTTTMNVDFTQPLIAYGFFLFLFAFVFIIWFLRKK